MQEDLQELVNISRFYGQDKRYVIAGGGNTSMKTTDRIWIKASGSALSDITEDGFAKLDRGKLEKILKGEYAEDPFQREREIKDDLAEANFTTDRRPSVETSLHDLINYRFVVHLHPTQVNGLMCSNDAMDHVSKLFGKDALYIQYTDPGYILFKEVEKQLQKFHEKEGKDPAIILLQNHGIFVSADTTGEINKIYEEVFAKLGETVTREVPSGDLPVGDLSADILPALRMMLSKGGEKTLRVRNNALVEHFTASFDSYQKISKPFTPDIIVYCKSNYIYSQAKGRPEEILEDLRTRIETFEEEFEYAPKLILIKGLGMVGVGDNAAGSDIILDVFEDMMKISWLSESFGGPHFLSPEDIRFIDTWEVENYRRKTAAGEAGRGKAENKIIIVTGAAMGFGAGIARGLFEEGANLVIADINEEAGSAFKATLDKLKRKNQAYFVKADVSDSNSLQDLIKETVQAFGGLDVFISNAGILRAGGLDEMDEKTFDLVTKINYNAYFYCSKYASAVMKTQHAYDSEHFMDIIQINSKSGLVGSKKNFAYAGGKFGGIGLTQSFALELAQYRIKVNSICPGNFFEGPLWSDPENGLFVQYLDAGKVPGAKSIEDVRKYYEQQVPMGRGCQVKDVLKAVLYIMDQEYETGQAIPVTGGQTMLN
jgi:rhamnose utilization protein RhaD (predicted bifunctional aldolase and dehydrogenase)/NAD(P)-dependent dehydrogenase (short-subunit alcohol dehydrogenase family)